MKRVHKRKFYDGDTANFSIGQGDLEVTPVQMAQAMATLANGGTLYRTRLVQQVQTLDNEVTAAYEVRAKREVGISSDVLATLKKAMVMVVDHGTASQAQVPDVEVAGKTGTAQWGAGNENKAKSRTAAWFVGFAPVDTPQYAFAVLVEGDAGVSFHGGTYAAPIIGKVLREVFKEKKPANIGNKRRNKEESDDNSSAGKKSETSQSMDEVD